MPEIVYYGPHLEVEFMGVVCKRGEPVAFSSEVASRALEQDCWQRPSKKPPDGPLGVVDYDLEEGE